MESLDVIRELIISQNLFHYEFYVVRHPAEINWRQRNANVYSKITNAISGIQFASPELIPISGRELFDTKELNKLTTEENPLLSVASMVKAPCGLVCHVPMMNIHLYAPIDISGLHETLQTLIPDKFYLMRTDRYFHIYGTGLMTEKEWKKWNLKFLMLDFLVSPRYIGQCLKQGYNLLRINATKFLKTTIPHLVQSTESAETHKYCEVRMFAVTKHASQLTKGEEPYFLHLLDVEQYSVHIAREIGLSENEIHQIRLAAVLHDSIEDTDTDYDDIVQLTDPSVADMVARLSNDKRKTKKERDREFLTQMEHASLKVQVIKLGDIYANLLSVRKTYGRENPPYLEKAALLLSGLDKTLRETTAYRHCELLTRQ